LLLAYTIQTARIHSKDGVILSAELESKPVQRLGWLATALEGVKYGSLEGLPLEEEMDDWEREACRWLREVM